MSEMNRNFEDSIITKTRIEEMVREFDPEIQKIFYDSYGTNLEAIPSELFSSGFRTEDALANLQRLDRVYQQKMILMRYGIVTGTPMTLEEVANEFGVTRERVRQVECRFFMRLRQIIRRKKLADFLDD